MSKTYSFKICTGCDCLIEHHEAHDSDKYVFIVFRCSKDRGEVIYRKLVTKEEFDSGDYMDFPRPDSCTKED